jgi:hypothetical protein
MVDAPDVREVGGGDANDSDAHVTPPLVTRRL